MSEVRPSEGSSEVRSSEVGAWLNAQAARLERLPSLEDALLGARPLGYVVHRLRYVYLRAILRCAFRIVELGLLARVLPFELLGAILIVRSVLLVADGLYWGALETMRSDVRRLAHDNELPRCAPQIRLWLAVACTLGTAALSAGALWVALRRPLGFSTEPGLTFVDVFVLGAALRWALEALTRTYHAGVYALRRVYRPLWSLLLVDCADVVVFALLFWWLGPLGAGASLVVVGTLRALLSWWFTRPLYAQFKLQLGTPRQWFRALLRDRKSRRGTSSLRGSFAPALANLTAQVDALLILGLLSTPGEEQGPLLLAALFHVVAPLQSAAVAWSRLFYFDFKRLEAWGSPFLLQRFEALLERVAWLAVLPVGVITFALMGTLWRGPFALLAFELSCLGLVRSWLSLRHMRAYSFADHRYLRRLFFGMLLVASSTPLLATLSAELALGTLIAFATLGLLLLGRSKLPLRARNERTLLGASTWVSQLSSEQAAVRIGLARVDRRLSSLGRLARTLAPHLGQATLGRLTADTLVWFEPNPTEPPPKLLAAACGSLAELCLSSTIQGGSAALRHGLPNRTWQRALGAFATQDAPVGEREQMATLQRELDGVTPGLQLISLDNTLTPTLSGIRSTRALRRLLLDAARGHARFESIDGCAVMVLAPAGFPRALILANAATAKSRVAWKGPVTQLVQRTELALAVRATWSHARPLKAG